MVYANKLVAAVKVNGQVLREERDVVTLPFGAEYSLLLKNLNSVRVQVKVSVDGQDATEGTWLIIQPNSALELERFIKNGNLSRGNRFKFIERTKAVEKHRGVGAADGLIRIEYKTEKQAPKIEEIKRVYRDYYESYPVWPVYPWRYTRPYWWDQPYGTWCQAESGLSGGSGMIGAASGGSFSAVNNSLQKSVDVERGGFQGAIHAQNMCRASVNDAGITVAGSESNQQFHHASDFSTHAQTDVLVLKLRGEVGGKKVAKAVTVKTKGACPTCGKKSKAKFCPACGTAMQTV